MRVSDKTLTAMTTAPGGTNKPLKATSTPRVAAGNKRPTSSPHRVFTTELALSAPLAHAQEKCGVDSPGASLRPSAPKVASSTSHDGHGKSNIVFVLTDDLSKDLVQYMPNVQKLQQEGVTFPNYFVTDSLCCPSRSSIFTGLFPHNTGVFTNGGNDGGYSTFNREGNQNRSYALILQDEGYETAMMGKYLNGYDPGENSAPPGWNNWTVAGNGYPEFNYDLNQNGNVVHYGHASKDYLTDVLNRLGVDFINKNQNRPFQIEIATFAPHAPYTPAPRDINLFPGLKAPRTPAFNANVTNAPEWQGGMAPLSGSAISSIDRSFRLRAQAVQAVDQMIGDLRQALAANGLENKTYFVFSSDNGYHMGQRKMEPGKQTAFKEDVNVPLVVVGPGIAAGRVDDHVVQNTDLCPTFAELAGGKAPDADGMSLVPLFLNHPVSAWRKEALVEHHGPNLPDAKKNADPDMPEDPTSNFADPPSYEALCAPDYTYVNYPVTKEREYYNLTTDPYQLNNTYGSLPATRISELEAQLQQLKSCQAGTCRPGSSTVPGNGASRNGASGAPLIALLTGALLVSRNNASRAALMAVLIGALLAS